jgi:hypothetical protein
MFSLVGVVFGAIIAKGVGRKVNLGFGFGVSEAGRGGGSVYVEVCVGGAGLSLELKLCPAWGGCELCGI